MNDAGPGVGTVTVISEPRGLSRVVPGVAAAVSWTPTTRSSYVSVKGRPAMIRLGASVDGPAP